MTRDTGIDAAAIVLDFSRAAQLSGVVLNHVTNRRVANAEFSYPASRVLRRRVCSTRVRYGSNDRRRSLTEVTAENRCRVRAEPALEDGRIH